VTAVQERPPTDPGAVKEEQPYVDTAPQRHTGLWLLGLLAVWVVGWALLRGHNTLEMSFQDQTAFHRWLNDLRDSIQLAAAQGNWFFHGVIGNISDALDWAVNELQRLLSTPAVPRPVPEVGWLGVLAVLAWVAYAVAGWRSSLMVGITVLVFGLFGYWTEGIDTLIITTVAVLICVVIGIPLGILMARNRLTSTAVTPVLDGMQTMPSFAYLTPLALIFGIGPAAAIVVTLIYSLPPLVRITELGIRNVAPGTVEAARSLGVSSGQMLRGVQLPMARRTIIVGINQCTMAALSMATIAVLVNGPGLGKPVAAALQNLDVGTAAVAGLAIVLAAIMLDRTTTAASERSERRARGGERLTTKQRRIMLATYLVIALVLVYLSRTYFRLAQFPKGLNIGPDLATKIGSFTDSLVNVVDGATNGFKNVVSYGFLNPLQSLLAESPWWLMGLLLIGLAFVLGGWRPAVVTVVCEAVILGTGLWHDAMVTLTMTIVATTLVMIVAVVLGVWAGRRKRVDAVIRPILDAFQTIPPFVYLVPALALFASSRFTAIVAAMAYAIPISTKLVADGIRGVAPSTVEAAMSAGITRWQMIVKVQIPMAREALVLATNQGLLYVLSMVVIGGLVGAGSLGYIVVSGFSQSQLFGKGLAAGIAITAMGIMIDRIMRYAAARYGRS
jgi:glycine betaine/proline transport system permease protein